MTIKTCSLGHKITTKNIKNIQHQDLRPFNLIYKRVIYFDCECGTTLTIMSKKERCKNESIQTRN